MTIYSCLAEGFPNQDKMNCAEQLLNAANIAYNMNLSKDACKLSAGFGGGMGIMSVCGAVTSGSMVLSHLFVNEYAHEGTKEIARLTREFIKQTEESMSSYICRDLRGKYRTPEAGCKYTIEGVAKALDKVIEEEYARRADTQTEKTV